MLTRASTLLGRARERIRAAAEHDPHGWPHLHHHAHANAPDTDEYDDDFDDEEREFGTDDVDGLDADIAGGDPRPPLGSPEPGAPDLDSPGGVSGPPDGARIRQDGRSRQGGRGQRRGSGRETRAGTARPAADAASDNGVPHGLRVAAAWSWRLLLVAAALYLLLRVADALLVVLVPVLVALLLAALLQPGAGALIRHGWPRSLAALTMLLVGLLVVAGIITLVVNRVVAGFSDLTAQVSQGLTQVQETIVRTFPITKHQLNQLVSQAQDALGANQNALATGALDTAGTVSEVFTGVLLTLLTLFFFLKDGRSIWLWLLGLTPRQGRAYLDEAARRSWRTLVSYVRATVAVALMDAIGIGIALLALGVPLALPLAALVFIGAFIPIIGSLIAGTVAVLVALVSNGFVVALIALGAVILVMQLEGHVFSPLLLGRAVKVHPLAVVLAIATGLIVAGVFGALIAVPIVACLNVGGTYLVHRHEGPRPPEPRPERARPAVTAE